MILTGLDGVKVVLNHNLISKGPEFWARAHGKLALIGRAKHVNQGVVSIRASGVESVH